jgi:hypothetical protein
MKFFETSAKDGTNVATAFNTLARDCVMKMLAGEVPEALVKASVGKGGAAAGGAVAGGAAAAGGAGGDKDKCAVM